MIRFSEQLAFELEQELQRISIHAENELKKAILSLDAVKNALTRLKEFMGGYTFKDMQEEILFFKEIKPALHKQLIYWSEVLQIESSKPPGGKKQLRSYYRRLLKGIDLFFFRNNLLRRYYKMGQSQDDETMFRRHTSSFMPEYDPDLDPSFSTVMSSRLSQLMAFEDVSRYINHAEDQLKGVPGAEASSTGRKPLTWTATKAQFIELAYALQTFGTFNHGQTEVKEVMDWLQFCFNIEVAHYYGYFQSMRIRKKDRTPFLKALIDFLLRWMDDSDEHPKFH